MIPEYRDTHVLVGPPGVGKTRYLADRVPKIVELSGRTLRNDSSPVLICSLTKAAAAEIGSRVLSLPVEATATLHAHAFRSRERTRVVDRGLVLGDWNSRYPALAITPPKPRTGVPDDVVVVSSGDMPGDEVAAEYERLRHRLVPLERMPERIQRLAYKWEAWKRDIEAIDFVDMLERASEIPPLHPDVIVVDEAQDLSPLGWSVVDSWAEHAGGLIAVGDHWQALYDPWAGADAATFVRQWREATKRGVLKQSWRVPATVQRIAMKWIRQLSDYEAIEYFPRREDCRDPGAPFVEGSVVRCDATWTDPAAAIQEAEALAAQGKSVLLIFTANYMTRPLCAEMRTRALCFGNPWRRDDPVWNPFRDGAAKAFLPLLDPRQRWTQRGLATWTKPLRVTGTLRRGAKKEIEGWQDAVMAEDLRRWFEPEAWDELQGALGMMNDDRLLNWWQSRVLSRHSEAARYGTSVVLTRGKDALIASPLLHPSTAHAAKGAEADHVFLFPDLSAAADETWWSGGRLRDPVVRAIYVAITRTREVLHICEPAGRRHVEL